VGRGGKRGTLGGVRDPSSWQKGEGGGVAGDRALWKYYSGPRERYGDQMGRVTDGGDVGGGRDGAANSRLTGATHQLDLRYIIRWI